MNATDVYARKDKEGIYSLRQRRYEAQLLAGNEHPHDMCAMAGSAQHLKNMCDKYWPDADYSMVKDELEEPTS
jgi:hypothetical protein